ncbi:MAG: protein translocase subunit SecD [Nocardioidaceae bacterium]|nr:protein translocase subunit SecD [Nocardioidaceae bacterium]
MSTRGSRNTMWRALATLVTIGIAAALALSISPKLGLDLSGGTQIVLQTQDTDRVKANSESTDRGLEVLRGRVDALGVSEPTLARSGSNRIIVELPGIQDPREAAEVIGQTAQLSIHGVDSIATQEQIDAAQKDPDSLVVQDENGEYLNLKPQALDGDEVSDASFGLPDQSSDWVVTIDFSKSGSNAWAKVTGEAACFAGGDPQRRIAILLDNKVISSPQVVVGGTSGTVCDIGQTGGNTQISGDFTKTTAEDLSVLIKGGALPVPVEVIEQRTVGPTLGASAIDASAKAAIIGILLTGIFIVFAYRLAGLMASLALATYALISYALLVWLGATLTLPGLAGFVLAIGLAIDANVLVLERAREEYAVRGRDGLAPALTTGFNKAWSAIIDSNVTTLLAGFLLVFFASGPVKGFGVTLSIGVIASMISALIVARTFTEFLVRRPFMIRNPQLSGIANTGRMRRWINDSGLNLVRRSGLWVTITAAVAVISIGGIVAKGLNLGVEFTGGRLLEYSTSDQVSVETARDAVSDAGFPQAVVQASSSDTAGEENITVRTDDISNDEAAKIEVALGSVGGEIEKQRDELIGPSLGDELRNKAMIAFLIAVGAQMLYLAWRFRWTYAAAAVLSMSSVVLTVVGIFAWWGKPIDGIFLAAVLSIIGLAVNDTIVVFDRIREHTAANKGRRLREVVNEAILHTIPRTINTGLGAMFILGALAFLGGDSLTDFALALLFGLAIGIVSTIFTASSIAILLEERWPQHDEPRSKRVVDPYADVAVAGRESGTV